MADNSHPTHIRSRAIVGNVVFLGEPEPDWRTDADVIDQDADREIARRTVPREEYRLAPLDEEGSRLGWGECRACGKEVLVAVEWIDGVGASAHSTGRADGCGLAKCGDKFPSTITRMACNPDYTSDPRAQQLQRILEAIEMAHDVIAPIDGHALSHAWECLVDWRLEASE